MARRPTTTLILLTHHHMVRADFVGSRMQDVTTQPRPEVDELALIVEVAVSQGAPLGKAVHLFSQELFSHQVKLDAKSFGLEGPELAGAIAFEAEPFSGLGHFESTTAFTQTATRAGEREFWVTQVRIADLERIRDVISELGSKLVSVMPAVDVPAAGDEPAIPLPRSVEDTAAMEAWLVGWIDRLARPALEVPRITPPARPLSPAQRNAIMAGFALVVTLACAAHYFLWYERVSNELRAEMAGYVAAKKKLTDLDKNIVDLEAQAVERVKKNADETALVASVMMQRRRLGSLFGALAGQTNKNLFVRKLDAPGGEPCIHGWCLVPQAPAQLADDLTESAGKLGWLTQAPRSRAQYKLPGGGPWEFDLQLRDQLVAEAPVEVKTRRKTP
jgi:hypothetical protein